MHSRRVTRPLAVLVGAFALLLSACSAPTETDPGATIAVETNLGEVAVPVDPARVAALDNTSMQTLMDFGVTPVVVPKPLITRVEGLQAWADDDEILDAGSHRAPDLEAISEAQPDLIIGGYRFGSYQDDLEKIATTIDISPDAEAEGGYVEGLRTQTATLGTIFDQQARADELIAELDAAVADATAATNGQTVFLGVTTAGKLDNGAGRIGRILEPLNLVDVFSDEHLGSTSHHNNSGLAPETIAQANPDWLIVFEQDALGSDGYVPSREVIEGQEALKNTTFVKEGQIIYLPADFYVTESIQAYTSVFRTIADRFA